MAQRPRPKLIWVETETETKDRKQGDDATFYVPFKYPSFDPAKLTPTKWGDEIPITDSVIYLNPVTTWKEVRNDDPRPVPGREATFFKKVDSSGNLVHPSIPNRLIYNRANIPPRDRIIWLDREMNAMQERADRRQAADQKLATENSEKISKEIRRIKADSKYSVIKRPLSTLGSIISTAMSPLLPADQVFTEQKDLIVKPGKQPQSKVSDLGLPRPPPIVTPADVIATPVNPQLLVVGGPLRYFLPHVSHKDKSDFLRWGQRDARGDFLFDPDQTLNVKLTKYMLLKAPFPSLTMTDQGNNIILQAQQVTNSIPRLRMLTILGENAQPAIDEAANFIRTTPYFVFGYPTSTTTAHAILVRSNGNQLTITDSTGQPWNSTRRRLTDDARRTFNIITAAAGITSIVDSSCTFQTIRGTCFLWATFFALFSDRTPEQLLMMIDDVVKFVGLPQTPQSREMIIMEIMYEFIQRPVLASTVNREEQMAGFGKKKRKLRGGMEQKFITAFKSYVETFETTSIGLWHANNPLAKLYSGEFSRDSAERNIYEFLMAKTDNIDKRKLGEPVLGQQNPEGLIPALKLLHFSINGVYSLTELYNEFAPWFPKLKAPTLETNFIKYRTYVIKTLLDYIVYVLEKKEERSQLTNEMDRERPTRNPPKEYKPPPPKKGGKLRGGISVDQFIQLENKFKEDIKRNRNNKDKVLKQFSKFLYNVLENLDQTQEKHRGRLEAIVEKLMTNAGLSFELNITQLVPRPLYDTFYDTLFPEQSVLPTEPLGKPTKQPPKEFKPPPPKKGGKLKGKAMPEGLIPLQQMAKEAYNLVNPKKEINGWELKKWTPTLKFYGKGNEIIIAVRGTKANAPDGNLDITADLTIPFNGIPRSARYTLDKAMIENFQKDYPQSQYAYFAVGHSLGGAIIDSLIRDRLIREAVSYNPAIQFSDINRGLPNRRIYYGSDPLYRLMGWWDVKSEHREPENRTWADFLSGVSLPAAAIAALPAHNLSNFEGGKKKQVVFA